MRTLLIYIAAAIAACCSLAACTSGDDPMPTSAIEAQKRGRADAKALCEANYTTERDLHAALLAVKSREWTLRRQGDSIAAGAYIDGFRQQLTESDKNLADKVF